MTGYAHPEAIVETSWVEQHLSDPNVKVVEVDVDAEAYADGHVPGAVGWNWSTELCDTRIRDIVSKEELEKLFSRSGIAPETTVVLYGDNNNWFACWAFWQMKIYGHADVRMMNGGRTKWLREGRPLSLEIPRPSPSTYVAKAPDYSIRAMLPEVMDAQRQASATLIDVRSPAEFTGEILAPPGLPETCQRGGHLPGAESVPWGEVCAEDGTFKSYEELEALYGNKGVERGRPVIAYCRIGERSSHTWFVLKYLLGHDQALNYDGSWTEWGNLVKVPIETGAGRSS